VLIAPVIRCPSCRSPNVMPVPRAGTLDRLLVLFRRRPFACRWCRRRFRVRIRRADYRAAQSAGNRPVSAGPRPPVAA